MVFVHDAITQVGYEPFPPMNSHTLLGRSCLLLPNSFMYSKSSVIFLICETLTKCIMELNRVKFFVYYFSSVCEEGGWFSGLFPWAGPTAGSTIRVHLCESVNGEGSERVERL